MRRAPCCDKDGLKKGPWTPEEDQKLIDYIQKHGYGNWRTLPKNAGLRRCGKSCRLRWTNYLRPDIKRGRFSFEEEETIIQLHSILGNKWSAIAARLPGRTDNEIKNYWNTHIRKRLLRMGIDPVTHSPRLDLLDLSSILGSSLYNSSQMIFSRLLGDPPLVNQQLLRLATSLMSSQRENQSYIAQSSQENQPCNTQVPNQYHPADQANQFKGSERPNSTTLTTPYVRYSNEAQLMDSNVEPYPSEHITDFNSEHSLLNYDWQGNETASNLAEDYLITPSYADFYCSDHSNILDLPSDASPFISNNGNQSFSFASVLSTPLASPTRA